MNIKDECTKRYIVELDKEEENSLVSDEWFAFDTPEHRNSFPTIYRLVDKLTDLI